MRRYNGRMSKIAALLATVVLSSCHRHDPEPPREATLSIEQSAGIFDAAYAAGYADGRKMGVCDLWGRLRDKGVIMTTPATMDTDAHCGELLANQVLDGRP
jgi:hypothetical protein